MQEFKTTLELPDGFMLGPVKPSPVLRDRIAQEMRVKSLENVHRWYEAMINAVEELNGGI